MEKVILWGTGKVAKEILEKCQTLDAYDILGVIDNDSQKVGGNFFGFTVYGCDILDSIHPDHIVVLTDYFKEICAQIKTSYPQYEKIVEDKNFFFKQSIIRRYCNETDPEILEVLQFIKENRLDYMNYSFREKYKNLDVEIAYDMEHELFYAMHNGKRLYLAKKYDSRKKAENYYKSLLLEQDELSPHRYLSDEFTVAEGDVVVDAGAAEGNFSLEIIDKASKLYIIEMDEEWIEALQITFKDYMDKVVIVRNFISSYDEGKTRRLDSLISEEVNFIKMDIEGCEWDALRGAEKIIGKSNNLKFAVCCYHSDFDQELIESFMDKNGIKHETTKGFMWFPPLVRQNYVSTSLNRGVIRGIKSGF